jgi:hypothetical protein
MTALSLPLLVPVGAPYLAVILTLFLLVVLLVDDHGLCWSCSR